MEISVFADKLTVPDEHMLQKALGNSYEKWNQIVLFTMQEYPKGLQDWKYSGKNYGWNFHISDKKRAIVYLLPRDQFFKIAFVFGNRAYQKVMESEVNNWIKKELQEAKPYVEGRGIRLSVNDIINIQDIYTLISIKISS